MDESRGEPPELDANAWAASREEREKGMGILAPHDDGEKDARAPYITIFRGIAADIDATLRVAYAQRMMDSIIHHTPFDASDLNAASWKVHHQSSLKGWRAKQIEEMTKMAPKAPVRRSLLDLIRGR